MYADDANGADWDESKVNRAPKGGEGVASSSARAGAGVEAVAGL